MSNSRTKSGISESEWIRMTVEEATSDPVGLWRIVRAGREQFDLEGKSLENFVRHFVIAMVEAGAGPIVGDKAAPFGWRPLLEYGSNPELVTERIVNEWLASNVDPNVDGIWFATSGVWK